MLESISCAELNKPDRETLDLTAVFSRKLPPEASAQATFEGGIELSLAGDRIQISLPAHSEPLTVSLSMTDDEIHIHVVGKKGR